MKILDQISRVQCRMARRPRAFTIIEIALCLAIIGFALVAIIAVLPRGLSVQRKNREETIIGQDADVWMNTLRNGARGYDDLTNYVLFITNQWTTFNYNSTNSINSGSDWYDPNGSSLSGALALTNGEHIVGLLSMPKIIAPPFGRNGDFQSNYVIAYVRAFSGAAVEKAPQTNTTILKDGFVYRMIVENFSYSPVDTNAFCVDCPAAANATNGLSATQITALMMDRTNLARVTWLLQTNAHDFRLRFRWPVLPNGEIPSYGQLTFRSMVNGQMTNYLDNGQPLFFVQSSIFGQVNKP